MKEEERLKDPRYRLWGPFVSHRQWGTVREDYSANGDAWNFTTHDMARSKAYRWGEEGIAGICDNYQLLCFSFAFWNTKDPILKEIFFGLNNQEGNHGEDIKERYYFLDNTPSHSYMRMVYHYPIDAFPYELLLQENRRRGKQDPEYELVDTGIFQNDRYFEIDIEYAKADAEDLLIRITVQNKSAESATLHIIPQLWYRNKWSFDPDIQRPSLFATGRDTVRIAHPELGMRSLVSEVEGEWMFCENETNTQRLYGYANDQHFCKDGFHNRIIHGMPSVNPDLSGTRAAMDLVKQIAPGERIQLRWRLSDKESADFSGFDAIFQERISEADRFYAQLHAHIPEDSHRQLLRQALGGLLWNKQVYHYNVDKWLKGDPGNPPPPVERFEGRNHSWRHIHNSDVISMPDKWEFPWYAAWDLAFQCVSLALVDIHFAREQLMLLTREWYMHPTGQIPAYEWSLGDVNPPVHAWAVWEVYLMGKGKTSEAENVEFLESAFHKLLIYFTWWLNREDQQGNNIFEGGFLGLDNIGLFDRNASLPNGAYLEQADGTSWMAMFALNMMHITLELSCFNKSYLELTHKFFEHFLLIAGAIDQMGEKEHGLWDPEDEFFYDQLFYQGRSERLKVRSLVCLVPLFAVEILDHDTLKLHPEFERRMNWFLSNRPDLAALVSHWNVEGENRKRLLSLLRGHRMKRLLARMLDENEFLSEHGIRSLSKFHDQNPYSLRFNAHDLSIRYTPGESDSSMFGGNSNWRGPVWIPMNFMIIQSLRRFHGFYGDDFRVEFPSGSNNYLSLVEIAEKLSHRIIGLFTNVNTPATIAGRQAWLFYEYFHGDSGKGLGADHHTGWTALVANLVHGCYPEESPVQSKAAE